MGRRTGLKTSSYDAYKTETVLEVVAVQRISTSLIVLTLETPGAILNYSLFITKPQQYLPMNE
jgi:hypothetical protein